MVDIVGVLAMQFMLKVIVAGGQPAAIGRIGSFGHGLGRFDGLLLQGKQVGQRAAGLFV